MSGNINLAEVVAFTGSNSFYEGIACQAIMSHLKELWKRCSFTKFHILLNDLFSDHFDDGEFLRWLAHKLCIRKYNLQKSIEKYHRNNFQETRGRNETNWQAVYDMWIECSIVSTDVRNGRNMVNISRKQYLPFQNLKSDKVLVEEKTNKRGSVIYSANRRISTITVRGLQKKLAEKGIHAALGNIVYLKPFFIDYASEKELAQCLCKLCLNCRLLFQEIMNFERKNGGMPLDSITEYFMCNCECPKSSNGYYSWEPVSGKCRNCKKLPFHKLTSETICPNELVTFSQFEETETPYKTKDKKTGEMVEKNSKKVERVHHTKSLAEAIKQLNKLRIKYLAHKYQVYNDIYHWPQILNAIDLGPVLFRESYTIFQI